jgi:hypothetical protein
LITLRCTDPLRKKLRLPKLGEGFSSTTALGDWFGNTVALQHARLILLVSEKSRLPVLVAARDLGTFEESFRSALSDLLLALGVPAEAVARERAAMHQVVYAKTNNRSVLGTLNDFSRMLRHFYESHPGATLHEYARELGEAPCGPLGYDRPKDVAPRLLAGS